MSYTRSYPRTMMVMNFNTNSTSTAMKRTRWPENLARTTIAQLILFISCIRDLNSFTIFGIRNKLKFLKMIKLFVVFSNTFCVKLRFQFLFFQIPNIIIPIRFCFISMLSIIQKLISIQTRNNPRI
jgi:hypothetical protein